MAGVATGVSEREAEGARLEGEIAELCGVVNAATGRLVERIGRVLETGCWEGAGIRSPEQWVAWKCGLSPARARSLVAMARRLGELPETRSALEAGELSEDQVAVVCRHAPAHVDAQASELARSATVTQLRRVLGHYAFAHPLKEPAPPEEEPRRVSFGYSDEGSWRLSALLPADEGALWEPALAEARDTLFRAAEGESADEVSWADALVAVADRSLAAAAADRPHRDRHLVLLHVEGDGENATGGHLHQGPGLSAGLRRFLSCDSRMRVLWEQGGRAVSVGRSLRTVPSRTRMVIEERDRGCRVPGCERSRWLHIHHLRHWEDGGTTDTANLVALCGHHHRLHHRGGLGIRGDADDPDGLVFTDARGRPLRPNAPPAPPRRSLAAAVAELDLPRGGWSHPTGERLDPRWVGFDERRRAG